MTTVSNLQRQALVNTYNSKLRSGDKEEVSEIIRPLPSPGVIRRGSGDGLQRSASLRQRSQMQAAPRLGAVGRTRSSSVPDDVGEDGEVEVMRQFVASDKRIINRGDSIRYVEGLRNKHLHATHNQEKGETRDHPQK